MEQAIAVLPVKRAATSTYHLKELRAMRNQTKMDLEEEQRRINCIGDDDDEEETGMVMKRKRGGQRRGGKKKGSGKPKIDTQFEDDDMLQEFMSKPYY